MDNSLFDHIRTAEKFQAGVAPVPLQNDQVSVGMGVIRNLQSKSHERNQEPKTQFVQSNAMPIPN